MAVLVCAEATTAAVASLPHVTVIGDSVLTAVDWNVGPRTLLERCLDVQMEVGICRTIVGESCPFQGQRVPTLLALVEQLGAQLGATVVVEAGYNDAPDAFADTVRQAVNALLGVGVQRIIWLTMHEALPEYAAMNAALVDVANQYPGALRVVDWNAAAAGHPDWFQTDGIHLLAAGADALATSINAALVQALAPIAPAAPPPVIDPTPLPPVCWGTATPRIGVRPVAARPFAGRLPPAH